MNNQSGHDGCTEQTSVLDLLVGPPRATSLCMGVSCARAYTLYKYAAWKHESHQFFLIEHFGTQCIAQT